MNPLKARRDELDWVEAVIAISRQIEQSLIDGGVSLSKVRTLYSGIDFLKGELAYDDLAIRQTIGFRTEPFS